ncbi:MAG: hypothetical protein KDD82_19820 [Planctomycetes bacterium]|nr:hypothetical protein [Planctomycetota bacterium]
MRLFLELSRPLALLTLCFVGCSSAPEQTPEEQAAAVHEADYLAAKQVIQRFVGELVATRPQWVPANDDPLAYLRPIERTPGCRPVAQVRGSLLNAIVHSGALSISAIGQPDVAEAAASTPAGDLSFEEQADLLEAVTFEVRAKLVATPTGPQRLELRLVNLLDGETLVEVSGP